MVKATGDGREDMASYLANVCIIMDSRKHSNLNRGGSNLWLANEYHRVYNEYKSLIKSDQDKTKTQLELPLRR